MKIFVTGATGFVGSHSAAALLRAGHQVRFLARHPAALRAHFSKLGLPADDVVQADMQDAPAVRAALQGCDGVLHAAAAVNLDASQAAATLQNNLAGVRHVLGAACEMGLPRLLYVSSLSSLFNPNLPRIDEAAPLAQTQNPYAKSKTDAEVLVRQWQAAGKPVQITYPAAVLGPDDPKLCTSNGGLLTFASKTLPITRTGFQFVDARDMAHMHCALLENPPNSAPGADYSAYRFILGGHYLPWGQLRDALQSVTGRRPPACPLPAPLLRVAAKLADGWQKIHPFETQLTSEAVAFMTQWVAADSARVQRHTGLGFRPANDTLTDTLRWLVQAGHMDARFAGKLPLSSPTGD